MHHAMQRFSLLRPVSLAPPELHAMQRFSPLRPVSLAPLELHHWKQACAGTWTTRAWPSAAWCPHPTSLTRMRLRCTRTATWCGRWSSRGRCTHMCPGRGCTTSSVILHYLVSNDHPYPLHKVVQRSCC